MKVAVLMGSTSDWEVMKAACETLDAFSVPYEKKVLSAHRTPDAFREYMQGLEAGGFGAVIAGAGGAAHLAGMAAAMTALPVIGIPIRSKALNGLDSLLSMVQMPSGIPVATVAIDGAKNAALLAVSIFALNDARLRQALDEFRQKQTQKVLSATL